MSAPEYKLVLSPRAQRDIVDILRYSGERWGGQQLQTYRRKLDEALQLIARNPEAGHGRDDLPATHRLYAVGSHVIVYRLAKDSVGIVRVLHQRMSLSRHI